MANAKLHSRGFTLIASSLMLLLLSGIAIGLMLMVNTEGKVGSTDLQNNGSFHAAEGGIEKMAADLNAVFQDAQAPTAAEICGLSGPPLGSAANEPALAGVTWTQYSVMPGNTQGTVCPSQAAFLQMEKNNWNQIISGPEQG